MSTSVFIKDVGSILDYGLDWSGWLGTDTIASSSWSVSPTGSLAIDSSSYNASSTVVWLSGGIAGTTYVVENQITTIAGRTDIKFLTIICEESSTINYLIPFVRLRVGDTNPATYRYSDEWISTALVSAVHMSGRWLNFKYLLDDSNNIYRNPNGVFLEAAPPVIEHSDEYVLVLMATIVLLEGSLENSAYSFTSWRDNEISFSNLEQSRAKDRNVGRLWDELMATLLPPTKRLARPIKQSLPGYKGNDFEIGKLE